MNRAVKNSITIDEMIDSLIHQIGGLQNYAQVESIMLNISRIATVNNLPVSQCFSKLEVAIEELSPMDLTSTQWSCFRYALICLREKVSMTKKYRRY